MRNLISASKLILRLFIILLVNLAWLNRAAYAQSNGFINKAYSLNHITYALNRDGEVYEIDQIARTSKKLNFSDKIIDACIKNKKIYLFGARQNQKGTIFIYEFSTKTRKDFGEVKIGDGTFIAANCDSKDFLIATSKEVIFYSKNQTKSLPIVTLPTKINFSGIKTSNLADGKFYIGANRGEWGGYLYEISLDSGEFKTIKSVDEGLCNGLFNPACDPVNGIVTSPWNKNCILFSVGLVHFFSKGRIVEYCNGKFNEFLKIKLSEIETNSSKFSEFDTMPFYELASKSGKVYALSNNGVFEIIGKGKFQKIDFGKFSEFGDFRANFNANGAGLLLSDINSGHSLSGMTPIMIRTE